MTCRRSHSIGGREENESGIFTRTKREPENEMKFINGATICNK